MLLNLSSALATARQSLHQTQSNSGIQTLPSGSDVKLGSILIRKHWISEAQLETTLNQQVQSKQKLGELLLKHALISDQQLAEALREQYWRRHGYWVIQD